jgi:hypothetical protein
MYIDNVINSINKFILGFSLLQGGPLPCFIQKDQLKLLVEESPSRPLRDSESQFRTGLAMFGLIEVGYML